MSDTSTSPSRVGTPVSVVGDEIHTARPYRFTWDPSTRKPGPESVSGTTEGRGDYFHTHLPPLGFLNISTTTLAVGALPEEWSSTRHGFHAISTVLNNPHKRQAPPKAHSHLPTVPPADLPRVRRKDFDSYLRAIGPEWERFEKNSQLGREGQAQIQSNHSATLLSDDFLSTPRRSSILIPVQARNIPPLESVPSVFFQSNFNLSDPATFNTVTEQDSSPQKEDSYADPFTVARSGPLLEGFSHYADTVEQHLVREISIRSTSFFAALTNLQDLQSESEQCLDRIGKLRTLLKDVDNNAAKRGLEMVRTECKMSNLWKVSDGVRMVGSVVEMTGVARGLVNAGQWGEALGVIEEVDRLWESSNSAPEPPSKGKPELINGNGHLNEKLSPLPPTPEDDEEGSEGQDAETVQRQVPELENTPAKRPIPPIPLSSLRAFSALPSHLRALTMEIAASLSNELVAILRNDLESRISGNRGLEADQGLRDRLKPLLLNLTRTKGLKEGMLSWRETVLSEVSGLIKERLPGFDSVGEDGGSSSSEGQAGLANHLRSMSQPQFMALLQTIYRSLLNGVEGLQGQGTIILELSEAIKSHSQKSFVIPSLEEDVADIISSFAELSNTQAAKVITYRAEQHAALDLPDFLTFFNDSWAFVVKCEVICRRMIVGLRGTVVGQAKLFLQAFHQIRISRSAKLVEDELWNPTEVTSELQHMANVLIDSAVRDSPELIIKSEETIFSPLSSPNSEATPTTGVSGFAKSFSAALSRVSSNGGSPASKHLRIEERSYYVVSATADVLVLLLDYLRVIVNLSMLTTDAMSRVIEFLKSFNSRTCQVVLGAGAMRSAGLKNITAKHLALASQSLSVVFELIPYVRETFRRHLSQKQAVMLVEFDKLKRDYQEHQNEIHAKLIAIMGDRLNAHIKTLQGIDWKTVSAEGAVNGYMELLVKETVTLHKVLSRYLAPPIVEYVMTQVFAAINHRLSEEYGKIELPNQQAKTRLLADAKYLHSKLAVLKNVGAPTGMLETVVAEKTVPRPNVPAPVRSNTMSANQRLKGLLSGRSSTVDKALPNPTQTPDPPPEKPRSLGPLLSAHSVYGGTEHSMSGSNLSLVMSPPIEEVAEPVKAEVQLTSEDSASQQRQMADVASDGAKASSPAATPPPIQEDQIPHQAE